MKKSKIAKFTEIILKIIFVLGTISLFFIPKLYNLLKDIGIPNFNSHTIYYQIAFYLCYIICLSIIFTLNIIFKNIYNDNPFKKVIELSLKIIAILFMALALIITIKTVYIPSVLSIAIIVVSFIASLCFYVLSQIFKVAIIYKNEVDFTI